MRSLTYSFAVRQQQGFEVYVLNNEEVELAVVPELGAKIISLKNLRTRREWMLHPPGELKLFRNCPGDDFSQSPLVGADECLPTIAPCSWQGRKLPDHGEVWSAAWKVDSTAWENGILKTSIRLKISPFEFERTIELHETEIRLGYQLNNLSARDESFLWAFHPLLKLQPGDQLEIPAETRSLLNNPTWIDAVASAVPEKNCAKSFAAPLSEGLAAIKNQNTGDRLQFEWSPMENDTLGLWLTRGGWHGHHHFAIEPTNASADTLDLAAEQNHRGVVPASDAVTWQIRLRVGS
jgi:galactose mutarotase-like enzyme